MTRPTPSDTAKPSYDSFALGRTPGQRGAEIIAGIRHELAATPETRALSRMAGRMVTRLIRVLERSDVAFNYVPGRLYGFKALIERHLPEDPAGCVVVDIAAGFSPRSLYLAQQHPDVTFIEIDLPDVVREKQRRLRQGHGFTVPDNLRWYEADLGVQRLLSVLEDQQVNIITAAGLNAYFSHDDITQIAANAHESLQPGGVYISDIPWRTGMDRIAQAARFFSQQAGEYKGIVEGPQQAHDIVLAAGFSSVETILLSELTDAPQMPQPLIDFAIVVAAVK